MTDKPKVILRTATEETPGNILATLRCTCGKKVMVAQTAEGIISFHTTPECKDFIDSGADEFVQKLQRLSVS